MKRNSLISTLNIYVGSECKCRYVFVYISEIAFYGSTCTPIGGADGAGGAGVVVVILLVSLVRLLLCGMCVYVGRTMQ